MKKMRNGLELSRQSWAALTRNRWLLVFPLVSGIGMLFVTLVYMGGLAGSGLLGGIIASGGDMERMSVGQIVLLVVITFVAYMIGYTIVIFSNTALVGAAMKLINGEQATVNDGVQIARARFSKIVVYAAISATVGMLASGARSSGRNSNNAVGAIIGAIIGGLIQGAWSVVVFFAIPVLVVEDIGVMDSLKRSFALFKQTWGEGFTGSTAIGGIGCIASIVVFIAGGLVVALGLASGAWLLAGLGIVVIVVGLTAIGLLQGAVNGIFQASMYHYAQTGEAGPFIDTQLAAAAFAA
jgi:hypothetical protein